MRVLYSVVCDDAVDRDDGRVDLHGVFQWLFSPGFPARQDRMTLVVVLEWDAAEAGRVEFRVDLLDPSRSPVLTINGHTEVGTSGPREPPQQTRLVMPLEGVVFPGEGSYEFVLHARGEEVPLTPMHLIEHPEAR